MTYSLISGVQKIKLSGAEKRAFAQWGKIYAQGARLAYSPPMEQSVLMFPALPASSPGLYF